MAIRTIYVDGEPIKMGYERDGETSSPIVLFLHGWGANRALMRKAFSGHLKEFCHYYVDLPGFGESTIVNSMDSKEYARILKILLDDLNIKPDLIVAHSFGGKLATLLNPPFLVLLSSAGILVSKSYLVRFKIAIFKLLKKIGLGRFYKLFASKDVSNMNQTMYETFKKVVDEDFENFFSAYSGKALIFWGKKDMATPLESGKRIDQLILNSTLYPLDGDHFFFLTHAGFIAKTIKENNVCSV